MPTLDEVLEKKRQLDELVKSAKELAGDSKAAAYARHKKAAAARQKSISSAGRDLGTIPFVRDQARRLAATASLQFFCETYLKEKFYLGWSIDHPKVIARLEQCVWQGGRFALAMPRRAGKTTLAESACLWACLTGRQEFIFFIGASRDHAHDSILSIKQALEDNDLLAEDWPEVCGPVRALEGVSQRAHGQHHRGERTGIAWRDAEIVLPRLKLDEWAGRPDHLPFLHEGYAKSSCAVLRMTGITGKIRGQKFARIDGRSSRPGIVVIDDPQTDASSRSLMQCEQREKVIRGAVMGLAGPGQKIAAICPCTVIRAGDLADRLLSRDIFPAWQGERMKLVYEFPSDEKSWVEYGERRADELRNDGDGSLATEFYRERQAGMDAGGLIAWPERQEPGEISGIQHAMNIFVDDPQAFWAEYQNQPLTDEKSAGQLQAAEIAARTLGLPRGTVPLWASKLTAFVDVQQKLLYYAVAAWGDGFAGCVIDYGTYPDQGRRYFTLTDAQKTLGRAAPGAGLEGSVYAGLEKLADLLLGREWQREDKVAMKIDRLLVDSGYLPDTVYSWCRQTAHASTVLPSRGIGIGAKNKPMAEYLKKPGEQLGFHWLMSAVAGKRATRHLLVDGNFWKSFLAERLTVAKGDKGALTLYGGAGQDHRLFAEHCTAEYYVETQANGRTVREWSLRPERNDNHWWDACVGNAAAASLLGVTLPGSQQQARPKPRVSYAEMQARSNR